MPLSPIAPTGVFTAWRTPTDHLGGAGIEAELDKLPGNTNPPIIFEPRWDLAGDDTVIWIISSGGADWGGAQVWVSLDGTTYGAIGVLVAGAAHGVLSATFPSGSDPDTSNTLSVNLAMSRGQITAGTAGDADFKLPTLAYCDGELIAFSAATLTGSYTYDLDTYIRRGCYGTTREAHGAGASFAWIQGPFSYEYPRSLVGSTVYFKFPSFNRLGGQLQELGDCVAYSYTLTGFGLESTSSSTRTSTCCCLPLTTGAIGPVAIDDGRGSFIGVQIGT